MIVRTGVALRYGEGGLVSVSSVRGRFGGRSSICPGPSVRRNRMPVCIPARGEVIGARLAVRFRNGLVIRVLPVLPGMGACYCVALALDVDSGLLRMGRAGQA